MPTTAHDGNRRGPLAALLILLSLFLGSASAAAASADLRGPATRLGTGRHNIAAALPSSAIRNSPDDEERSGGGGQPVLPAAPGIITERLSARPLPEAPFGASAAVPRPASAFYRARAPPAS